MNPYVIVFIVSIFLLGLAIGFSIGISKGYAIAMNEIQQQMAKAAFQTRFNSTFKEEDDGNRKT